jgi:anaerobic selenocysteine-containing dehydrogenase
VRRSCRRRKISYTSVSCRGICRWVSRGRTANSGAAKGNGVKVVHVTCPHDCPDACSMRVTVDQSSGRAVKVEGDPTHPITRGYLCNKVNNYLEYAHNPNRVLYPRRRVGPRDRMPDSGAHHLG